MRAKARPPPRGVRDGAPTKPPHKQVRTLALLGLREAKDLVEQGGEFEFEFNDQARADISEAAQRGIELSVDVGAQLESRPAPQGMADAGIFVLRYGSGPNKIQAIKLVRELSGLGLKDAKDLVEQGGEICRVFGRSEADALAARFAAFGSTVVIASIDDASPPPWRPSPSSSPSASLGFDDYVQDDDDF